MIGRWVAGLLATVVLVSVGGVGFAAYTSLATINTDAVAGSFLLTLSPSSPAGGDSLSSHFASCGFSPSGSAITLSPTNLLPGDFCTYLVVITDLGTIPGTGTVGTPICSGSCLLFSYLDNSPLSPNIVGAGGSPALTYTVTITDISTTATTPFSAVYITFITGTAT